MNNTTLYGYVYKDDLTREQCVGIYEGIYMSTNYSFVRLVATLNLPERFFYKNRKTQKKIKTIEDDSIVLTNKIMLKKLDILLADLGHNEDFRTQVKKKVMYISNNHNIKTYECISDRYFRHWYAFPDTQIPYSTYLANARIAF
jgi:hypothetical protein